jgi:autotransporter-associated beta strand protein
MWLGSTGDVVVAPGDTLNLGGVDVGTKSFEVQSDTAGHDGTLIIGGADGQITFDGGGQPRVISLVGAGGQSTFNGLLVNGDSKTPGTFAKVGPGTLTLAGAQAGYTGPVTVGAGTLALGVDNALPNSVLVAVRPGATLDLAGHALTANAVALQPGSTLAVHADATNAQASGDITSAGPVSLSGVNLALDADSVPAVGQTVTILKSATGIAGQFANLPPGATVQTGNTKYQVQYVEAPGLPVVTGSPAAAVTLTGLPTKIVTRTALVADSAHIAAGDTANLHATISPASATGTVTFMEGGNALGPAAPVIDGVASLAKAGLAPGQHAISAVYSGDANDVTSASGPLVVQVDKATAGVSVSSSNSQSMAGQSVQFTAAVAPANPAAGSPTGQVAFFDGMNRIGVASLDGSGHASISTSALSTGSHTITAVYVGDSTFSLAAAPPIVETVNLAPTTLSLTTTASSALFGPPVTLTANIASPGGTPNGTVTFQDGASTLGAVTLQNGAAQLTVPALAVGSHSITASFAGDNTFAAATSPAVGVSIAKASPAVTIGSTAPASTAGQAVWLAASVAAPSPGSSVAPTGVVEFRDGVQTLGTAPVVNGLAVFGTRSLAVGSHSITATYDGDAGYSATSTGPLNQVVSQSSTTTIVGSVPNPWDGGKTIVVVAAVVPTAPGAGTPTGSVTFQDGSITLGTATLVRGRALWVVPAGGAAVSHAFTASYSGDPNFRPGSVQTLG